MSLITRKPRPIGRIDRSPDRFRDDRLFIIACDDTYAPKQYFNFLRLPRIQIHVVPTLDGTSNANDVLQRLLGFDHEDYDELWLILDTDHMTQPNHIGGFAQVLREANRQGVKVALSMPCFELWLLLHHREETFVAALRNARDVEAALRLVLGGYNKTSLKKINFPLSTIPIAIERARRLDTSVSGGDIPQGNTTRVYQLLDAIIESSMLGQLPIELARPNHG